MVSGPNDDRWYKTLAGWLMALAIALVVLAIMWGGVSACSVMLLGF